MRCCLDDLRPCGINADHGGRLLQPTGRGGMTRDGGTKRGGTFHGEMDCYRESQRWTTACNSMLERDGNDQDVEDGPKQTGSCCFARHNS